MLRTEGKFPFPKWRCCVPQHCSGTWAVITTSLHTVTQHLAKKTKTKQKLDSLFWLTMWEVGGGGGVVAGADVCTARELMVCLVHTVAEQETRVQPGTGSVYNPEVPPPVTHCLQWEPRSQRYSSTY